MSLLFNSDKWVEYRCSHCGALSRRREGTGKPSPGNCSRRSSMPNGQKWTIVNKVDKKNRKLNKKVLSLIR